MSDEKPCTNCGHCPTCGRSNFTPYQPYRPVWISYPWPYYGGTANPYPFDGYSTTIGVGAGIASGGASSFDITNNKIS